MNSAPFRHVLHHEKLKIYHKFPEFSLKFVQTLKKLISIFFLLNTSLSIMKYCTFFRFANSFYFFFLLFANNLTFFLVTKCRINFCYQIYLVFYKTFKVFKPLFNNFFLTKNLYEMHRKF